MSQLMLRIAGLTASVLTTTAPVVEQDTIFPKGELSRSQNHTGDIWLDELVKGDATFDTCVAVATYEPGAKLDWHVHPGGQVLPVTEGSGYYQERGQPARIIHKGDVIKSAVGVEHWHGALPGSTFAYVAVARTFCAGGASGARLR